MDTKIIWIFLESFVLVVYGSDYNMNIGYDDYYAEEMNFHDLEGEDCLKIWSCDLKDESDFERMIEFRELNCRCDADCSLYGDCCHDAVANVSMVPPETVELLECQYIQGVDEIYNTYVVQKCPQNTNKNIRQLCEEKSEDNLILNTPVTGEKSGLLYKNMYCAMCNREYYEYWTPGLECGWRRRYTGNISIPELKGNTNCQIRYHPPKNARTRQCFTVTDNCGADKSNDACATGNFSLVFGQAIHRNTECAMCNGESTQNLTCIAATEHFAKTSLKRFNINYSYRLLIDINTNTETRTSARKGRIEHEDNENHATKCRVNEIFDPFNEVCRKIYCELPYVLNNSKCFIPESEVLARRHKTKINFDPMKDKKHLSCPKTKLNQSEYQIINETGKIYILAIKQILDKEQFYLEGQFAFVCINYTKTSLGGPAIENLLHYSSAEKYLSFIGIILSIVALLIGLIIYIRFKQLRNIPGKNLMCLMVALCLGQVLFLSAPSLEEQSGFCTAVALLVHYLFLSSFFWMNLMAFDICFTFSKSFMRSSEGGKSKRFYYYLAYGCLTPFCIVIFSVCFDQTDSDFRALYGEGVCWIANRRGLLVFFLAPLILIITSNIIMFILTSRSIYISDKNSSQILQRKDKCKLFIYIKLCIIMGLTWISGFVATFSNITALWYIFIIFNSLQGVFIFIAFVCNKKVYYLIRGRTRSKTLSSKTTSNNSKSTRSTRTVVSLLSRNSESAI